MGVPFSKRNTKHEDQHSTDDLESVSSFNIVQHDESEDGLTTDADCALPAYENEDQLLVDSDARTAQATNELLADMTAPENPEPHDCHAPMQEVLDASVEPSRWTALQDDDRMPQIGNLTYEPAFPPCPVTNTPSFTDPFTESPKEPRPHDRHAPTQGVLDDSVEPSLWMEFDSKRKLLDRAVYHQVRLGDHVAYFKREDIDKVDTLLSACTGQELCKPSEKKAALIRLRMMLSLADGTPAESLPQLEQVARLFHDALEPAADTDFVEVADLEACLATWVPEPTRYAPFKDLTAAVEYMCLPVADNRVVGMALKHKYEPMPESLRRKRTEHGSLELTPNSLQIRADPKVEYKRVSLWNEASCAIHGTSRNASLTV